MPSINKISYEGIEYDILGEELADLEADTTALKEDFDDLGLSVVDGKLCVTIKEVSA